MAATAVRKAQRRTRKYSRHAWRAVRRRPVPAGIGAVAVAGILAFGVVGVVADQGPEFGHSRDSHLTSEQQLVPALHGRDLGPGDERADD